jgi:hypothetical protein
MVAPRGRVFSEYRPYAYCSEAQGAHLVNAAVVFAITGGFHKYQIEADFGRTLNRSSSSACGGRF